METPLTDRPSVYVRVTMSGDKAHYELMFRGEKLCDVKHAELVEIALQFVSATRFK